MREPVSRSCRWTKGSTPARAAGRKRVPIGAADDGGRAARRARRRSARRLIVEALAQCAGGRARAQPAAATKASPTRHKLDARRGANRLDAAGGARSIAHPRLQSLARGGNAAHGETAEAVAQPPATDAPAVAAEPGTVLGLQRRCAVRWPAAREWSRSLRAAARGPQRGSRARLPQCRAQRVRRGPLVFGMNAPARADLAPGAHGAGAAPRARWIAWCGDGVTAEAALRRCRRCRRPIARPVRAILSGTLRWYPAARAGRRQPAAAGPAVRSRACAALLVVRAAPDRVLARRRPLGGEHRGRCRARAGPARRRAASSTRCCAASCASASRSLARVDRSDAGAPGASALAAARSCAKPRPTKPAQLASRRTTNPRR